MISKEKFSKTLPASAVSVTDPFWKSYMELARTQVIPYQWEALNDRIPDAAPSHCMENFKVAAGMKEGEFQGCVFQDSDFAKWIEAVGYVLMWHPDPELEKTADEAIDIVCAAQQPDGYLDTYYIINGLENRWTNLMDNHELYCLGHLIEGAVAYYQATGKDKLLNAMIKYVDHVDSVFGPEPGKLKGYPGHEVIEMALIRLYEVTGNEKHLRLAKYFVDQRGQSPLYFEEEVKRNNNHCHWSDGHLKFNYYQAGKPVREQMVAEGHAVRAVYLYSGMADVARMTEDQELAEACERLFDNIANKQMYITGGIGASEYGEAFSYDYDLPNDTVYAETCASIGLVFFARRMLEMAPKGKYADVMERALYNGIISGLSLDGKSFFYVNPLEVVPVATEKDHLRRHVKVERQKWFGCACCPPNAARLLASIGSYAYTVQDTALYMHLYMGGQLTQIVGGKEVTVDVETSYPWNEDVNVSFALEGSARFTYGLRIPSWCREYTIRLNGEAIQPKVVDGYALIDREWSSGDKLEIVFAMPVTLVAANPKVRENIGKVAVTRGPVVYCIEEADNGADLHRVSLGDAPNFTRAYEADLLGGVVTLTSQSRVLKEEGWDEATLYQEAVGEAYAPKELKWIPYYSWTNRTPGEMLVWVHK